ncbi:HtaA domain-containing protein [Promicromonospora sp. MEB111]|uniref:HtaA domain-containing protein n=1 Tax=Promicromonospora sp. MEB111 TaxID=3040301 RepID=UPI0025513D8C|nr:HtaA domain-containing protein [Promicromonospora sp. MEB111]
MTRSRPAGRTRHRGHALIATGLAATLGTALAAAPLVALTATAAEPSEVTADSGDLAWGFRESFRNYVGRQTAALPPIGAVPVGERITLVAPGEFDENGTPAANLDTTPPNETLPYLLPVTGGTVTDADNLTIASAGGAVFHFPSHAFTVTVKDVAVVVDGGVGTLVGDLAVEIPENNLGYEPGTYGGDDVVLGEVATTTVDVAADAVTVSGTGVTLTAEGAAALQGFLAEGAALDGFTVSAQTSAPTEEPEEWNPTVTLSKASGLDPDGETVTATGSGFDPAANVNTSGRPPVAAGAPTGVYVVFGSFGDPWRPSEGAGSGARTVLAQRWALPEPSYSQVKADFPNVAEQLVLLNPDGTFTAELAAAPSDTATGTYGVYTYAAGGAAANAAQELGIPVTFATPGGEGEGDIDLEVTVPEGEDPGEPGAFTWTVVGGAGAVSLGTAEAGAGALTATGDLKRVTVSDTRAGGPAWSINGTATDFFATGGSASFPGSSLGWSPSVSENTGGAVAGALVRPGAGSGLTASATLVSAPAGHAAGSVTADAALDLRIPLETPAGDYASVLTLTAVG